MFLKSRRGVSIYLNLLVDAIKGSCCSLTGLKPREASSLVHQGAVKPTKIYSPRFFRTRSPLPILVSTSPSRNSGTIVIVVLRNEKWYLFCACHSHTREQRYFSSWNTYLDVSINQVPEYWNSFLNHSFQLCDCFIGKNNPWNFLLCHFVAILLS